MRDQDERVPERGSSGAGTGGPGPGEKACPFCAETIKAAAIRCRWCQADLTGEPGDAGSEPVAAPAPAAEAEAGTDDATGDEPLVAGDPATSTATRPRGVAAVLTSRRTSVVLGVLTLLAAVLSVRMVLLAQDEPAAADGDTPLAAGSSIASEGVKSAGLSAATEAVETVLGYRHDRLEDDMAAARAVLGEEMRAEYDETMGAIEKQTRRNRAVVEATVVAASAISATEHDVRALLFVNTTTEGKHLQQPRIDLNRVVVSLHRDGGDWVVTDLDAL